MRKILKNEAVQAFLASILCILAGILIGYIVLLMINPEGAGESILKIIKKFSAVFIGGQQQAKCLYNLLGDTGIHIWISLPRKQSLHSRNTQKVRYCDIALFLRQSRKIDGLSHALAKRIQLRLIFAKLLDH